MSLLPPDYWKNQGPLMGNPYPNGGNATPDQEQTMPNPISPSMPQIGGGMGGQNDFLKRLMEMLRNGPKMLNNQQPQNPIGPSGNLPGASQRSFGFINRSNSNPYRQRQPGEMVPNGWGGMMPYDPNFTGIT